MSLRLDCDRCGGTKFVQADADTSTDIRVVCVQCGEDVVIETVDDAPPGPTESIPEEGNPRRYGEDVLFDREHRTPGGWR